jgi:hypothetical protein
MKCFIHAYNQMNKSYGEDRCSFGLSRPIHSALGEGPPNKEKPQYEG